MEAIVPKEDSGEILILLPVDNSDNSLHAFNWYLNHFHRPDHVIGLAHVYTLPKNPSFGKRHGDCQQTLECQQYSQAVNEVDSGHAALLKKYQDMCNEKGVSSREYCIEKKGSIGETICELAKMKNVCCIVLGKRDIGSIKRKLYGSVSEHVLHNAQTAVVIVPADK